MALRHRAGGVLKVNLSDKSDAQLSSIHIILIRSIIINEVICHEQYKRYIFTIPG
jgi:hypothetical protein